ncbi:hypothetical protein AUEXF2481DRAFT_43965 [Aureobasidium subglaciale EXF-2481]|uniref:FAR1 domain-containing protein n=1 Tax=Aureobasidium subglaciale (strain EXF-2481) TaxID=1043005 RepID=A0A074YBQ5_AURSE|nr:uncharacterized protein AUEXF2481DRAFT_43965 [Aureobasidium subglaciale EXF-2481]KAI5200437.1 hypothetical protein E4T38_06569 [Aureobasidium subglaciale]KAI5218965.1 hypothetical protein E4T40_06688 [Aureobasidium subglaciale]KAI5222692.1 hypothetical protein E4T41_06509 [Aureobasidium subglaciale]KAI5260239.1 hypothetical protein E4T46_06221 [Aureobasidium subglaciale]KEQ91587.1 hypothetical protein AUEXF2481DRAFT_43965 [Aureobasidium subglaciale EXF-2481]
MDFDDQLIEKLNAPGRHIPTLTPPPPPPSTDPTTATPTTSTPDPSTLPSYPRPSHTAKDNESYYIKPIPSGLRGHNLAALMSACHNHTLHNGFDIVKKAGVKPTTTKNGRKSIVSGASYYKWHITCVLGGKPKNTRHLTQEQRRRDKGSLKVGCPSRVWAWAVDRDNPDGEWEIRWGDTDPALHNHPPVDVKTLPNHRRRAREQDGVKEAIERIAASGVGRKEGLRELRDLFPGGLFSEKDMANELQKYKMLAKQQQQRSAGEQEQVQLQEQVQQDQNAHADDDEEELEDLEEDDEEEGEAERNLHVQLQTQTGQAYHLTQQLQQPQQHQHLQQSGPSHQQLQQHQHMYSSGVSGVPGYW